ncbi:MAG: hypothetical protein VXY90_04135 [Pseudomonadota bacterium]|nr:hypothetical protein [Pseudomonadota bacterium]
MQQSGRHRAATAPRPRRHRGAAARVRPVVVRAMVGLRVDQEDEIEGLDVTAHGERSYML